MRLVESLGGESVVLRAEDAAAETVRYARKRNATKIVVGKPTHPRWYNFVRPSFLDDIVRKSLEIDVHVISGRPGEAAAPPAPPREVRRRSLDLAGRLRQWRWLRSARPSLGRLREGGGSRTW